MERRESWEDAVKEDKNGPSPVHQAWCSRAMKRSAA